MKKSTSMKNPQELLEVILRDFRPVDEKRLHKVLTTQSDMRNFIEFYSLYQSVYDSRLIVKEFINHKGNIEKIISLEKRLRINGISSRHHMYSVNFLDKLQSYIQTEEDWNTYYNLYKEGNGIVRLTHMMVEYIKWKKQQEVKWDTNTTTVFSI